MFVVKRRLRISGDNRTAVVCTVQTRYYWQASMKASELQPDTIGSGFPPETEPLKQVGEIGLTNT